MATGRSAMDRIDVFDASFKPMPRIEQCIPGVGQSIGTPVAGLWLDGVLQQHGAGGRAKQHVAESLRANLTWNRSAWTWYVQWYG
jgi:hypothetical protein